MERSDRFWVTIIVAAAAWLTLIAAGAVRAQNSTPFSPAWNIAATGKAASSGELQFRVTPDNGEDAVEVTVFVLSGTNETGVASSIRRALNTRLDPSRFNVTAGEGANVQVNDARADGRFGLELLDSDVENVRVMVASVTPVAPPAVPPQNAPANPSQPPTAPAAPGEATPSAPPASPSAPPAQSTTPPASPSAPPAAPSAPGGAPTPANGGAGAPASAPPPPPASPGGD